MDAESILSGLNGDQRAAVLHDHDKGAQLLILAGAGSGKTSVLTKRIQYRILCGVQPEKILALTFTAKAAAEMRERVQKLFPNAGVRLCTFHSLALHILKSDVPCDLSKSQTGFIPAYQLLGFEKMPSPTESSDRDFLQQIKKTRLKPGSLLRENLFSDGLPRKVISRIKPLQQEVLRSGKVVFEDLIYLTIKLLETNEVAACYFREQWAEILVDEYQDINPSQYRMVKNLLGDRKSLFVVGDDDQAIYGFRGADIGNINRFRDDFKDSTLIRLEWNYRSVPNVLHLANDIFKNKPIHLQKVLRAGNPRGSGGNPLYTENRKPEVWVSDNPVEEIQRVVASIKELRMGYDLQWKNFAILVRYNRQRLYYEEALRDYNIPVCGDVVDVGDQGEVTVEDGIHVETVHASKGLQYAVVYYAGLAEDLTPGECTGNRKQRLKQLDEERRLYYVGVTRAEAYLILLYCKKRFWKGRLRKYRRSRFLPKPQPETEIVMPMILFRIWAILTVFGYMFVQICKVPYVLIRYGKNSNVWVDKKIQEFGRYTMNRLRIDLTIDDQAKLGAVDWNRPVFVIGNHGSFLDIPIAFLAIQKTIGFVAKKTLGRIPFLHFWMVRIGCVLINRTSGNAAVAIRKAIAERGQGARIFIFPEGHRSKDGKLGPFKSGAFRFAAENDGIILPLVIRGSGATWEQRKSSKRCKVSVQILDPVDVGAMKKNESFDLKKDVMFALRDKMSAAL